MVFLGLVLAVAAVALGVDVAVENTAPTQLTVFGQAVPALTQGQVFLSGVGLAVVLIAVIIAAVSDLRSFRIHNALSLPLLASGLIYHGIANHGVGFYSSIGGALFGAGILTILYLLGTSSPNYVQKIQQSVKSSAKAKFYHAVLAM